MDLFANSVAVNLKRAADDTISIDTQEKGFVAGLLAEGKSLFNGGLTTSVGLSKTVAEVGKVYLTQQVTNVVIRGESLRANPFKLQA